LLQGKNAGTGGKVPRGRLTELLSLNNDGCNKQVLIVVRKSSNPHCFKNIKEFPVKYYANKKAWMTMIIFTKFVRALDAHMDVQSRKMFLSVDSCAAHL
jgi:hypothetical protein